jgi:hypothetical protein
MKIQPIFADENYWKLLYLKNSETKVMFYRINDGPFQPLLKDIGFINLNKPDRCDSVEQKLVNMLRFNNP